MKRCTLALLLVAATISFSEGQNNIINLFANRDFVRKQVDCILDRDPCDVIGRQIKGLLPEMIYNNCQRCTANQAMHAQMLLRLLQRHYPDQWSLIQRYYQRPPLSSNHSNQ